jgi:subtilisin family serine protease
VTKAAIVLAAAAALLVSVPAAGAHTAGVYKPVSSHASLMTSGARYVPGEVLVGFRPGVSRATRALAREGEGLVLVKRFAAFRMQLLKLPRGLAVRDAVRTLSRNPAVAFAEPNYLRFSEAIPPTDALFGDEWDLNNTGQSHLVTDADLDGTANNHAGTADADIDAPEAWSVTEGASTAVIAVVDTGVDVSHPDLAGQLWTNPADPAGGGDDDGNGKIDDTHGWDFGENDATLLDALPHFSGFDHGTHVSGTIAAAHDDSTGTVGVCPGCRIMALKIAENDGTMPISNEIAALAYAKSKGVKIVNMSFGGPPYSNAEREAIRTSGMLAVVSAGNDSLDGDMALVVDRDQDGNADASSPSYPAAYTLPNVLTVAASNDVDRYGYSTECVADFGFTRPACAFTNWGHDSVDVAAPGVDITSTVPGGGYETWDGTSMAAPHVAGVAGLLLSDDPSLAVAGLKNAIMRSVDKPTTLRTMYIAFPIEKAKTGAFTRTSGRVNANTALSASIANATPVTDGNIDHARGWTTSQKSGSVGWPADINDVFKRRLLRGHTYEFTLVVPARKDYDLYVWKPGTKEIWQFSKLRKASFRGPGADEVVRFNAATTGTYAIQVSAWLFRSGSYTLKIKRVT